MRVETRCLNLSEWGEGFDDLGSVVTAESTSRYEDVYDNMGNVMGLILRTVDVDFIVPMELVDYIDEWMWVYYKDCVNVEYVDIFKDVKTECSCIGHGLQKIVYTLQCKERVDETSIN